MYITTYYFGATALDAFFYEETGKVNSKFHHRINHEDQGGERRYSSTRSLTSALGGVGG